MDTADTASPEKPLAEQLAGAGLRATRQRLAVLRVLRESTSHPTAAAVGLAVREEQPSVSQKTIYEVLEALVSAGLASRVTDGGEPYRYEGKMGAHYHARCQACGTLVDLPARADSQIRGRTPMPEGFEVRRIRVTLEGLCLRCRDEI